MFTTTFLLIVSAAVMIVVARQCSINENFEIHATQDSDGHWEATCNIKEDLAEGNTKNDKGKWKVNVDVAHCSENCVERPFVHFSATTREHFPKQLEGYEYFQGVGSYKHHRSPSTWFGARDICNAEGTHLAVINSEEESKVLQLIYARDKVSPVSEAVNYVYVGFHDLFEEGQYLTIFDVPVNESGFTRWSAPTQPDNFGGNERCGSMYANGGLNDIYCYLNLTFFCEQEQRWT